MRIAKLKLQCYGSAAIIVMSVLFQDGKKIKLNIYILFTAPKYIFFSIGSDFVCVNGRGKRKNTIYLSQLR